MTDPRTPLGRLLPPDVSEPRLARQYAAIASRTVASRAAGPAGAWALVAMVAALVLVASATFAWLRLGSTSATSARSVASPVADGAIVESAAEPSPPLVLAEGSRVALASRSRVTFTRARRQDVRIDVERGGVDVEATHVEGRSFVVVAAGYEVRVVGTRFSVREEEGGRVQVRVAEGRVTVTGPAGDVRPVSAGDVFDGVPPLASPPLASSSSSSSGPAPVAAPPPSSATGAPATSAARRDDPASDTPRALLDRAQEAKAAGRIDEAAALLESLRRDHRRDPRAALAAYELGRLRLDAQGDPAGAAEALRDALALSARTPRAPFREDAEARRVEALERAGAVAACAGARAVYLADNPGGVHRGEVTRRCGGR